MAVKIPRLVIAGLSGDSGKTVVSLALVTAFKKKGLSVAPFKKGPDYIDSAWLTAVANSQCRNLDAFMVPPERITPHFITSSRHFDLALIEGNRGIYDGKDASGKYSTAELAKLLQAPLILVVNATKSTRTVAALVNGCRDFDSEVMIKGVILNRIAGKRHEKVIKESIEKYCDMPVLGSIPKLGQDGSLIPGRHLGLITPAEFEANRGFLGRLDEIAEKYLNVDELIRIAQNASEMSQPGEVYDTAEKKDVNIGFFSDSIFTFYYPENLEALERAGAHLIQISSVNDEHLPDDIDALYIGGGFPETQAEKLLNNQSMMKSVKDSIDDGMPVYAECGGLIYLSRSISWKNMRFEMAGVFPIDLEMHKKPAGHGYSILKVDNDNPFFAKDEEIRGHEFHYSSPLEYDKTVRDCMRVIKGAGVADNRDGLVYKNCLATYTHIHALGTTNWAPGLVGKAREYRGLRKEGKSENFSVAV